jgi:hypothetical protein
MAPLRTYTSQQQQQQAQWNATSPEQPEHSYGGGILDGYGSGMGKVSGLWMGSSDMARKGSDDDGGSYDPMESGDDAYMNHQGTHQHTLPLPNGPSFSLNTPPPTQRTLSHTSSSSRSTLPLPIPIPIPALSTIKFVLLCFLWYFSSALSSNTGKVILNNFRYPVTLTIVQFFFVAGYCYLGSRKTLGWTGRLRQPTKAILRGTLPMAVFQVGGHIFSSMAISRVPVSTVHTIKVGLIYLNYLATKHLMDRY